MRKKIFSVRFSLRNEKKDKQEHIDFPYECIAQMASSRPKNICLQIDQLAEGQDN